MLQRVSSTGADFPYSHPRSQCSNTMSGLEPFREWVPLELWVWVCASLEMTAHVPAASVVVVHDLLPNWILDRVSEQLSGAFKSLKFPKWMKDSTKSEKWALKRIPVVFRAQHCALFSCRVIFSINLSLLLAWEVLVALSGSSWQRPMEDSPSVPVQEPPPANRDTNPEHNGRGECIHARPCLRVHVCETASAVPHKKHDAIVLPLSCGPCFTSSCRLCLTLTRSSTSGFPRTSRVMLRTNLLLMKVSQLNYLNFVHCPFYLQGG